MASYYYVLWCTFLLHLQTTRANTVTPLETSLALVSVSNVTTTFQCGIGCAINAVYHSPQRSSFIEFSAYSITSAAQTSIIGVLGSGGECHTTTEAPVTTTPHTISLNKTMDGTDLDNFAATRIEQYLGFEDCFAHAVLTSAISTSTTSLKKFDISTSTRNASPSGTVSSPTSTPKPTTSNDTPRRGTTVAIALGTVSGVLVIFLLVTGVFVYRWRRKRMRKASAQPVAPAMDGTDRDLNHVLSLKPELPGDQSRYEMAADQSRFEMSGRSPKDENNRTKARGKVRQELNGIEPSSELSA